MLRLAGLLFVGVAFLAGCGSSAANNGQVRDLQATIAALQKNLVTTPTPTIATVILSPSPSPTPTPTPSAVLTPSPMPAPVLPRSPWGPASAPGTTNLPGLPAWARQPGKPSALLLNALDDWDRWELAFGKVVSPEVDTEMGVISLFGTVEGRMTPEWRVKFGEVIGMYHDLLARAEQDVLPPCLEDAAHARLQALIALDRDASVIQDALIKDNATLLTNALARKHGDVPGIGDARDLFLSSRC